MTSSPALTRLGRMLTRNPLPSDRRWLILPGTQTAHATVVSAWQSCRQIASIPTTSVLLPHARPPTEPLACRAATSVITTWNVPTSLACAPSAGAALSGVAELLGHARHPWSELPRNCRAMVWYASTRMTLERDRATLTQVSPARATGCAALDDALQPAHQLATGDGHRELNAMYFAAYGVGRCARRPACDFSQFEHDSWRSGMCRLHRIAMFLQNCSSSGRSEHVLNPSSPTTRMSPARLPARWASHQHGV